MFVKRMSLWELWSRWSGDTNQARGHIHCLEARYLIEIGA
jgi:hypothetical protein